MIKIHSPKRGHHVALPKRPKIREQQKRIRAHDKHLRKFGNRKG